MEKEYTSENIQSLNAGEHIRMRPKLYFEKCFNENSLDCLPFEVLCHAFDEYFDGNCKKVEIEVFTNSFSIKYDVGISLEEVSYDNLTKAELIMTKMGACKNEKKHLSVGEEFCELGMSTINFASEYCELLTISNGKKGVFKFKKGETIFKEISISKNDSDLTIIQLKPDKNLFENLCFTSMGIKEKSEKINSKLNDFEIEIIDRIV